MNFINNPTAQTRRSNSASTRSAVNAASAAALPANTHDENTLPSGVEVADQSAVMAGKVVGAQRRSALSAVSVNAASATVNALENVSQRNLRAKTVKQTASIVAEAAKENVPIATSKTFSSDASTASTSSDTSSESEAAQDKENAVTVFPVKSVLRSAGIVDKENVAPAKQAATSGTGAAAVADWDDLDLEDAGDPLMVSDYVVDIFEYMRKSEKSFMPKPNYMINQKELDWPMRSILIDWLTELHWKLKLLPETLFLSVNIIDRFLSCRAVAVQKLQLVGLAATLLASKYEEVIAPSINNLIFLSDNSYDAKSLLEAERYVLQILGFSLGFPSPMSYLRRISKADNYDIRTRTLGKYLMEVALLDANFVACPPSLLAAVAIYAARLMLKCGPWVRRSLVNNNNLIHYSGYQEIDVRRYCNRLLQFLQQRQDCTTVHRKYSEKKFMRASIFVYDWLKRHFPNARSLETVYYSQ